MEVFALEIITGAGVGNNYRKRKIEEESIKENIKRFTQAENTPPMLPSQIDLLGWTANTKVLQNILEGVNIEDPRLHAGIKRMIPYHKTSTAIKLQGPIDISISIEDYILG
jgi:hypothetical protein